MTLEETISKLGYDNVVIKPNEWKEIAKEYAKAKLEEAAEKARTKNDCTSWNCQGESIDKESITNINLD